MSKKKPCGLDYCPQEEIVGAYASCSACAWGNDGNNESEEKIKGVDDDLCMEGYTDTFVQMHPTLVQSVSL